MQGIDRSYIALLRDVMENGRRKADRTGTGTVAVFGRALSYGASPEAFPLLTTKKMFFRGVVEELLWFLRGETNIRPLIKAGVHIWTSDAYKRYLRSDRRFEDLRSTIDSVAERKSDLVRSMRYEEAMSARDEERLLMAKLNYLMATDLPHGQPLTKEQFSERIVADEAFAARWGDLGPVYGRKWRDFGGVDQLREAVDCLRSNPDSRRMLVSAWDPSCVAEMTLPPCHYAWQLQAEELTPEESEGAGGAARRLNLCFVMRSVDCLLGMPYDVASYALLLNLIAREVGMAVGTVTMFTGDTHIYLNHLGYVKEQVERDPDLHPYPKLVIAPGKSIFGTGASAYTSSDVRLEGYSAYPNWKNVPLST